MPQHRPNELARSHRTRDVLQGRKLCFRSRKSSSDAGASSDHIAHPLAALLKDSKTERLKDFTPPTERDPKPSWRPLGSHRTRTRRQPLPSSCDYFLSLRRPFCDVTLFIRSHVSPDLDDSGASTVVSRASTPSPRLELSGSSLDRVLNNASVEAGSPCQRSRNETDTLEPQNHANCQEARWVGSTTMHWSRQARHAKERAPRPKLTARTMRTVRKLVGSGPQQRIGRGRLVMPKGEFRDRSSRGPYHANCQQARWLGSSTMKRRSLVQSRRAPGPEPLENRHPPSVRTCGRLGLQT